MPPLEHDELIAKFRAVMLKIKHDLNEFLDLLIKEEKPNEE
jgi:hypothetical protein